MIEIQKISRDNVKRDKVPIALSETYAKITEYKKRLTQITEYEQRLHMFT